MKVGILTWYQSRNHGAVLQAYASQKALAALGFDSYLMPYERRVRKLTMGKKAANAIKRLSNGTIRYRRLWKSFDQSKAGLFSRFISEKLIVGEPVASCGHDAVMIGSDMVFDLNQGYNPYMFGIGLDSKHIFSYAACCGGMKSLMLADKWGLREEIRKGLSRFSALGYRDGETREFLHQISDRFDTAYTIDPVLLYGFDRERDEWRKRLIEEPYLLIYAYHGCMDSAPETRAIRAFAAEKRLKVVSCGYAHPWCDLSINASPEEFLSLIDGATYVITDTFHGTVFSLLFHKRFCAMIRNNAFKVKDLLSRCGQENRIVPDPGEIPKVFEKEVDFAGFDRWLEKERSSSRQFLLRQLS